jgi:hypothetical protein
MEAKTPEERLHEAASAAMGRFFADKPYRLADADGKEQPIPQEVLYDPKHVKIVVDCSWEWAYSFVDEALKQFHSSGGVLKRHPIKTRDDEVKMNAWIVQEFNKHLVTKDFQGGMTILYMMLCEGLEFKGTVHETKKGGNAGRP